MTLKRLADAGSDATDLERRLLASHTDPPKPREADRALVWQRLIVGFAEAPEAGPPSALDEVPLPVQDLVGTPAPAVAPVLASPLQWAPLVVSGVCGLVLGVVATTSFFLLRDSEPRTTTAAAPPNAAGAGSASLPPRQGSAEGAELAGLRQSDAAPQGPRAQRAAEAPHGAESQQAIGSQQRAASEPSRPSTHDSVTHDQASPSPGPSPSQASPPEASAASELREDATLLRRAREQLGRGLLSEASDTLTQSRTRFPHSRLSQEREALTIELYMHQGRTLEARSLATGFLSKYPHSPHAVQVRRALETGSRD
ncbi:MAG TPA: hypothetical protein VFU02_21265 [Polyangiaceae bacterium]|nr:hypothetical protein [Polyangiaceae bacterium]